MSRMNSPCLILPPSRVQIRRESRFHTPAEKTVPPTSTEGSHAIPTGRSNFTLAAKLFVQKPVSRERSADTNDGDEHATS